MMPWMFRVFSKTHVLILRFLLIKVVRSNINRGMVVDFRKILLQNLGYSPDIMRYLNI
jgi:hypothetical protein